MDKGDLLFAILHVIAVLFFAWALMLAFSLIDLIIASQLFKYMLYKVRVDATLDTE